MISVYEKKHECCGCMTCINICPTKSIKIEYDEYGFSYPKIDQKTCIDCGKCRSTCPMINVDGKDISFAYAAVLNDNAIEYSASGGAFYAIAKAFIEAGGVVFGCAFDNKVRALHIEVNDLEGLRKLQGSKYVQSDMNCHNRIKELLNAGKQVLFSGTPCQVASIKAFVGAYSANLFCVEIVCHGVPNAKLWRDYIMFLEMGQRGKVVNFQFRAKGNRQQFCSRYVLEKNNIQKTIDLPAVLSYYYFSFLRGKTYRRSCYYCPFAQIKRQADITICDYWGYSGERFKGRVDISAALIQGEKGKELFDRASDYLVVEETDIEAVAMNNEQLKKPTALNNYDEHFMEIWRKEGARGLEREHRKKHWKAYVLNKVGLL